MFQFPSSQKYTFIFVAYFSEVYLIKCNYKSVLKRSPKYAVYIDCEKGTWNITKKIFFVLFNYVCFKIYIRVIELMF